MGSSADTRRRVRATWAALRGLGHRPHAAGAPPEPAGYPTRAGPPRNPEPVSSPRDAPALCGVLDQRAAEAGVQGNRVGGQVVPTFQQRIGATPKGAQYGQQRGGHAGTGGSWCGPGDGGGMATTARSSSPTPTSCPASQGTNLTRLALFALRNSRNEGGSDVRGAHFLSAHLRSVSLSSA